MESILISAFPVIGTLIGSLVGILIANRLTTYRLHQLERKVEKHNNVIERLYQVESDLNALKQHHP